MEEYCLNVCTLRRLVLCGTEVGYVLLGGRLFARACGG